MYITTGILYFFVYEPGLSILIVCTQVSADINGTDNTL